MRYNLNLPSLSILEKKYVIDVIKILLNIIDR